MSKKRSWLFYIIVTAVSLVLGFRLLWTFTPVKDEVGRILIDKLRLNLGESVLFLDFSVGPGSISFYDIRAVSNTTAFNNLQIKEIEIGFSIIKLLTHKFQLPEAIQSVTLINPRLTLQRPVAPSPTPVNISPEQIIEEAVLNMQKFPGIDYITISDGEICWQYLSKEEIPIENEWSEKLAADSAKVFWRISRGLPEPILEKLGGKLTYQPDLKIINLNLRGKLPGLAASEIDLIGEVNLERQNFIVDMILNECTINSDWPFWKLDFLLVENAQLQGAVRVNGSLLTPDSLVLKGGIRVKDVSAYIFNQHVQVSQFTIVPRQQSLYIEPFECRVEDGHGRFGGTVDNIFYPEVNWQLDVTDYAAKNLKNSHDIFEYAYEGKISARANFSGPVNAVNISADLQCPELLYAVVPFHSVNVNLAYNTREKFLKFEHIRADFMKFRTEGTGEINFQNQQIKLWLDSDIAVPENYFTLLDGLNEGKILLHTNFSGNFGSKLFGGDFRYWVYGADTLFVKGRGPFFLDDQWFNFSLHSDELAENFSVKGNIKKVFSDPNFTMLDVKDFPVQKFTENPLIADFVADRSVNFYFAGPYNFLQSKMKIVPANSELEILALSAGIRDIFMDNQKFKGKFFARSAPRTIEGDYEIAFSGEGVATRIDAPGLFHGELFSGTRPDSPFKGKIDVEHFSIADFLQADSSIARVFREGTIEGEMVIGGTVRKPEIAFNLNAEDFIINDVGYYATRLSGKLENYALRFDDLWVRLNSDYVFNADFSWNVLNDSLRLVIRAEDVESNFLAETVFKDPEIISGNVSYAISASGLLRSPSVSGELRIKEGFFKKSPFDSIAVVFRDSLIAGEDFWKTGNHIIKIDDFSYVNSQEYSVQGRGVIGIDPDSPMDITIHVRGNVLAELPEIQPYFKNPQSDGTLYAEVQGTRTSPYFEKIDLTILDGSLEFDGVIPPLAKLKAEVELSGGNFIHIKTIEGFIDNHWARIYNIPEIIIDTTRLSSWYFEEFDLDFGVLILETKENGIPLAIPGLMEEGDIGYFAAKGKNPGEKFYFAGPPELPIARGALTLYNCRVTFPFIGMEDEFFARNNKEEKNGRTGSLNESKDKAKEKPAEKEKKKEKKKEKEQKKEEDKGKKKEGEKNKEKVNGNEPEKDKTAEGDKKPQLVEENKVYDFLMNMRWDIKTLPGNNNHYFVNIPAYVGEVFMDLNIDNASRGLEFTGRLADDSFRIEGEVESFRGNVEYLDAKFRVERFGAEFNRFEIFPEVYGTAYTTVRDSTGNFPRDVYLKLYVIDPVTKKEVSKGRWEDFRFKLVSRDEVIGETQQQVLAALGYSVGNLQYKAGEVGLTMTENFIIRPLFRPVERGLERTLRLDYVRLRSNFTANLFYMSFQNRAQLSNTQFFLPPNLNNNIDPALLLIHSSGLTMGKYLIRDIYLSYSGQLVAGYEEAQLGINHTFGLEYRVLYNLLLELELNKFRFHPFYNESINSDFRIRLRHSFNF